MRKRCITALALALMLGCDQSPPLTDANVRVVATSIAGELRASGLSHEDSRFTIESATVVVAGGDQMRYGEIKIAEATMSDGAKLIGWYSITVVPSSTGSWKVLDATNKRITDGVEDFAGSKDVAGTIQKLVDQHR